MGGFMKSKSANADHCDEGAGGWMIPHKYGASLISLLTYCRELNKCMGLKRNLTHFNTAKLCNCLKNPHRSWLAHMSFQFKVNGFGLPAKFGSRHRHIEIREDPGDEFTWRTVTLPLPNPPPPLPLFSGIVYSYHSLWLQRKCIFEEEETFWIVKVLFIYIYQSMTWISAFEAAEKHKIMVT